MKLVEAKLDDLKTSRPKENFEIIMQFADSEMECAEVTDYTQKSALCLCQSLNNSIDYYKIGGVKAKRRNGRVFLVKSL